MYYTNLHFYLLTYFTYLISVYLISIDILLCHPYCLYNRFLTLSTVMNKLQHEYVGTLSQFLLQAKRFNANFRLTRPSLTSSSANDVTLVACRLLFHPSKEIIDRISEVKQAWSRFTFHSHWVSYKWLQANLSLCNRYRLQLPVRRPTW